MVTRPPRELIDELKSQPGGDIGIHGSIGLAQSMFAEGLIDELRLVIAPTVAGSGRHLFDGAGSRRQLQLLESERTPSGALLLSYAIGHTVPGEHPQTANLSTEKDTK